MKTTRNFKTAGGHKVTVTGTITGSRYEIDVAVNGFGSQGGIVSRTRFSKNGNDYVGIVGNLPLTQEQMNIIDDVRRILMAARDEYEKENDMYNLGTYEEVEINHPWMKNTY